MREPFGDEHLSDRPPIALDDPQLAAILVFVAIRSTQVERRAAEQFRETEGGLAAQRGFFGALRLTDFRRVDIGDADFRAVQPERIAVNDAGFSSAAAAKAKAARRDGANDRRWRIEEERGEV